MKLKHLFIIVIILAIITVILQKCHPCEFLILARSGNNYGKAIVCRPDNWTWGTSERDTKLFYIVICKDMTTEEGQALLMQYDKDNVYFKSLFLKEDLISAENLNTLKSSGKLSLTSEGITQCLKEK